MGERKRVLEGLREAEGALRGLDREMTQQEVVRAIKKELRKTISQSYLSQIESGARPHLTNSTRLLLAKFFKVHPGYLVDDPEGFQTGRNRLMAPMVTRTKNSSTMPCTMANTGPAGGLPGATALSAGTLRKLWITSTNTLK